MQKDSLDIFSGFCKNPKLSSMLNDQQIIFFLRAVNYVLFQADSTFVKQNFASEKELIDPILPYLRD